MHNLKQLHTLTIRGDALPIEYGKSIFTCTRIHGTEAVGELFEYTVQVRAPLSLTPGIGANVDLDKLVGTVATVTIQIEGNGQFIPGLPGDEGRGNIGAGEREISGMIDSARFVRIDDRNAIYELILRPWLALAERSINTRIFLHKNLEEITSEVLHAYPGLIEYRLDDSPSRQRYSVRRNVIRQHWESDYAFLRRLWEVWGWVFWFEHSDGDYRLILSDGTDGADSQALAYRSIRYLPDDASHIDEEYIDTLDVTSTLTAGKVTTLDHDYALPRGRGLRAESEHPRDTANSNVEQYIRVNAAQPNELGRRALRDAADDDSEWLALVRMESERCKGLRTKGHGNLRGLASGRYFTLTHHPHQKANREYVVLSCTLDITDILSESGEHAGYSCHAHFELFPYTEPYRLEQKTSKPRTNGPEVAVVVGPKDQRIWTDELHRVLVQFVWDREGRFDEAASIWLRVAVPWQGSQMGASFVPRVGDEVLVDFLHGDPDLAVIVGSVPNEFRRPGWKLPDNYALAGLRSQAIKGGGANHIALDDTPGELQVQLASDQGSSILSLGFIRRIVGNKGRQDAAGEGFELRTDKRGALRAGEGLLITTEARTGANAHALDMGETLARLTQAREIHEALADLAHEQWTQNGSHEQREAVASIKRANDEIRGNGTAHASAGQFPELGAPHLVLASPSGIDSTTGGSTHQASDNDHGITTGRHISLAAGRALFASVRERIALFAERAGIALTAAAGKVRLEAQTDDAQVVAHKNVEITSADGWINLTGEKGVRIHGGGSVFEISPQGLIGYTRGANLIHAASHATDDPKADPASAVVAAAAPRLCLECLKHAAEVGSTILIRS